MIKPEIIMVCNKKLEKIQIRKINPKYKKAWIYKVCTKIKKGQKKLVQELLKNRLATQSKVDAIRKLKQLLFEKMIKLLCWCQQFFSLFSEEWVVKYKYKMPQWCNDTATLGRGLQ